MIKKAFLKLVSGAGKILQVAFNGRVKQVNNLHQYGFFSSPPENSQVVLLPYYDNYYGIAFKNSLIPTLAQGEVGVGNYLIGAYIKFDKDGNIEIKAKKDININITGECNITAPTINLNGDVVVSGNITATDGVFNGKSFNTHTHTSAVPGSPTSPPN